MSQLQVYAYVGSSPAVRDGIAYFGPSKTRSSLSTWKAGEVLWEYEHPQRKFPYYSSVAITDDRIVIGGRDKMMHAIDTATGEAIWTYRTRARIDSSPVIVGDRVGVRRQHGRSEHARPGHRRSALDLRNRVVDSGVAGDRQPDAGNRHTRTARSTVLPPPKVDHEQRAHNPRGSACVRRPSGRRECVDQPGPGDHAYRSGGQYRGRQRLRVELPGVLVLDSRSS